MRYAVFSDVHAFAPALECVLADAEEQKAEMRICLGDVVGYGPDPSGALALCRANCDMVLAGNHDAAVARRIDASAFILRAQEAVARHRHQLSEEEIDWLANLPMCDVREDFMALHGELHMRGGHLAAGFGYVLNLDDAERLFFALPPECPIVFVGHTHEAVVWKQDANGLTQKLPPNDFVRAPGSRYIVNVGAVGFPRFERETTYAIYDSETGTVTFRRLPFDFKAYYEAMEAQGVESPTWVLDQVDAQN